MLNFDFDKFIRLVRQSLNGRWIFFLLVCTALGILAMWVAPQRLETAPGQSVSVIALLNINVVLLIALLFAVGRNIFRLVLDRQNKVLGSKLRQRLVFAFVGITIIPIFIIFLLASGIINRATDGWFSTQVESIVGSAQDLSRSHIQVEKERISRLSLQLKNNLNQATFHNSNKDVEKLKSYFKSYSFDFIALADLDNQLRAAAYRDPASGEAPQVHLSRDIIKSLADNEPYVFIEERPAGLTVLTFQKIEMPGFKGLLITARMLDPNLNSYLKKIQEAFSEYQQLKIYKGPIKTSYLLTLALITGVILFGAIWFGMYLAREISVPLKRIADSTAEVAAGNYDLQLPPSGGDDELSELVQAFNKMISDLKSSRGESERRRQYLETILNNLGVGVFGFGTTFRVLTVNQAARALFQYSGESEYVGRAAEDLFNESGLESLHDFLAESVNKIRNAQEPRSFSSTESELNVIIKGQKRRLMATLGRVGNAGNFAGAVLLIDDVTELVRAQQVSVWREVARRLAHEIKNPLTPIKLAAQRLIKNSARTHSSHELESAGKIIVDNSDAITVLVDEFSKFGRMPVAEFHPADINSIIQKVIQSFTETAPDIVFQFIQDSNIPVMELDESQISRCIANLLDNASAAIRESGETQGKIILKSRFNPEGQFVQISIADNGPGIPLSEQSRIFEPYYTTKASGTGLGLAIVSSIIADHHGKIRVFSNNPKGVLFVIELPVKAGDTKGRRFI